MAAHVLSTSPYVSQGYYDWNKQSQEYREPAPKQNRNIPKFLEFRINPMVRKMLVSAR